MKIQGQILMGGWGAILALVLGCGSSKNDDFSDTTVELEAFADSQFKGLLMTNRGVGEPIAGTSSLLDYEFATGQLRRIQDDLALDSPVFQVDDTYYLFDRSAVSFRTIDLTQKSIASQAVTLTGAAPGDPTAVVALDDEHLLLAMRHTGKLLVVTRQGSVVQTLDTFGLRLKVPVFRPSAVMKSQGTIYVLHQGVDENEVSNQSQRLYRFTWDGSRLARVDETEVIPLKASLPMGFFNQQGESAVIVGLCPLGRDPNCVAGAQRLNLADGSLTDLAADLTPYALWFQIVDGEESNILYGSVIEKESSTPVVTRMVLDGSSPFQTIHSYGGSEDRLYGIFVDPSTKTLMVGGESGSQGTLTFYDLPGENQRSYKVPGSPLFGVLYQ